MARVVFFFVGNSVFVADFVKIFHVESLLAKIVNSKSFNTKLK